MGHVAEPDDHPGVRQPVVADHLAGDALCAQMQIVQVAEGDVGGCDGQVEGADAVGGQPSVQGRDRRSHGRQMRETVLDRSAVRHVRTP